MDTYAEMRHIPRFRTETRGRHASAGAELKFLDFDTANARLVCGPSRSLIQRAVPGVTDPCRCNYRIFAYYSENYFSAYAAVVTPKRSGTSVNCGSFATSVSIAAALRTCS
jgi:hypothetical protein